MRKYLAEFIGTFALVFCGTGAIIIDQETGGTITHVGIAMTFGLIILVMIYAFGDISGAHFNPAVSIAFAAAKQFPIGELPGYIIAQTIGAFAASGVLRLLFPDNHTLGITQPSGPEMRSFVLEAILTFILMTVILGVATGSKEKGMFAGIAIGSTILLEAMFAGPICGASMNPVRSLAPAILSGNTAHLWIYLTAPVAGAVPAVFLRKFIISNHHP